MLALSQRHPKIPNPESETPLFPPSWSPEHLDPRQRLALQPFEEGAASGRDIGEPLGRAGRIERRDRVAAACHRYNLPGGGEVRRGFGDLNRAGVEKFEFE